jgi:SpoVK/Ycf46/Vps4 family AAA+-type ATPase
MMNTSTRNLRAGWVRLWLLRLYSARLDASANDESALFTLIYQGLRRLRVRRCAEERDALRAKVAAMLERNDSRPATRAGQHPLFADLARVFSLDADALLVFAFFCAVHSDDMLGAAARDEKRYPSNRAGILRLLGDALGLPQDRLRRSLRVKGALLSSGLISIYHGNYGGAADCVELGDGILAIVSDDAADASAYLEQLFELAGPSDLTLADYAHVQADVDRIRAYLDTTPDDGKAANVLLYGPPGTGKTQLARTLAGALGCTLYLVRTADSDGDPIEGRSRLKAYEAAQRALSANRQALLLFDEIEDVLGSSEGRWGSAVNYKSWLNRQLEVSRVPCIWIGNGLGRMDDSQLRRFDVVLELTPPTRSTRRAMLQQRLQDWNIAPSLLDDIASNDAFAPAHYDRAARMLDRMRHVEGVDAERVLRDSLNEILQSRGLPALGRSRRSVRFDTTLLRTDQPIAPVLDLLERQPSGRLCLYGPPGTGKTALAAHIAERLDRPLLKRRAAELLGSYIGQTEQAIARMFHEAEREGAVLCLDEADSFLRDRQGAQRSWEVTQVNELLTRLEDFEGIFVASTNLMDSLDAAALRRFDFKLRFEWLDLHQRTHLLEHYVQRFDLKRDMGESERMRELGMLDCVAPGDFAALSRRLEANAGCGERELLRWLRSEQALKPGSRSSRIGFVA